jgi:hypothetical protein
MRKYFFVSVLLLVFLCAAAPFQEEMPAPCSTAYGTQPTQPLPKWLQSNVIVSEMATQNRYDLLSGRLITAKIVDGSICPSGGLTANGSPNACGVETSQTEVVRWQNRYDPAIVAAAQASNVPSYLMKAMIAVESQFWPAPNWMKGEIGLGQMTDFGADLVLSYRVGYFQQVCRQAFGAKACGQPYPFLSDGNRAMLRGLVLRSLDASCPTCLGGIDPAKGDQAVTVLAETVAASCTQSGRIIRIATGKSPAALMSYEDFWRFVLANYHSGAGCMFRALQRSGNPTNWPAIAAGLPVWCQSGSTYIRRIEENIKP